MISEFRVSLGLMFLRAHQARLRESRDDVLRLSGDGLETPSPRALRAAQFSPQPPPFYSLPVTRRFRLAVLVPSPVRKPPTGARRQAIPRHAYSSI